MTYLKPYVLLEQYLLDRLSFHEFDRQLYLNFSINDRNREMSPQERALFRALSSVASRTSEDTESYYYSPEDLRRKAIETKSLLLNYYPSNVSEIVNWKDTLQEMYYNNQNNEAVEFLLLYSDILDDQNDVLLNKYFFCQQVLNLSIVQDNKSESLWTICLDCFTSLSSNLATLDEPHLFCFGTLIKDDWRQLGIKNEMGKNLIMMASSFFRQKGFLDSVLSIGPAGYYASHHLKELI